MKNNPDKLGEVHQSSPDVSGGKIRFDVTDPDFIADPYAVYDSLRADGPLHPVAPGVWLITQYDAAAKALLDKRLTNRPAPFALVHERNRDTFVAADVARHLIAFQDPPEATPPRRLLTAEVHAVSRILENDLDDLAADVVLALQPDTTFDFVDTVATPFAVRAMCRIFGFPPSDADRIKAWSSSFFRMFHSIPDRETLLGMNVDMGAFRVYIRSAVASRQGAADDDLLSLLMRADFGVLGEVALVDNVMLLVADAIENVWAGIASALMILIEHHSEAESYLAAGGSWNSLIDECLRLESPSQYQSRIATEPLDIGGTTLNKYSVVLVGLAAANRDPATFNDPTAFQPSRKGAKHLTFGLGRHACIGGALARLEMTAILRAMWPLVERLDMLEDTLHWEARAGHRWLRALPLHLKF